MLIGALLLFLFLQGAEAGERLMLTDRSESRGVLQGLSNRGMLQLRLASGAVREIPFEDLIRIRFGGEDSAAPVSRNPGQVLLAHGAVIQGNPESLDEGGLRLSTAWGSLVLRPEHLRAVYLSPPTLPVPDLKPGTADVLVLETPGELSLVYGRLHSLGDQVQFEVESVGGVSYERAKVKRILLRSREGGSDLPPGLYVRVRLLDGSRWLGVLEAVSPRSVRLFSHLTGSVELPKAHVHSLAFVQQARSGEGNLLIGENTGVREFDRQGRELWRWYERKQEVRIARRLENGNILLVCPHAGEVLEVRQKGKSGAEIVWTLSSTNFPYDALRLPGGNTLVAEHHAGRLAEYEPSGKCVRTFDVQQPQSLQRLENGNLVVATPTSVFDLDRSLKIIWTANLRGKVRPWRAERLENGNTLLTDHQRGIVVELDPGSNEVWRQEGLSRPVHALRVEDGNTLILEQGAGRLIEVDPLKPGVRPASIHGLQNATSVTIQ